MSSTTETRPQPTAFDRTVGDLKHGVESATTVQSELSQKMLKNVYDFAALSQDALTAFSQATQIFASGSQDLFKQVMASSQSAYAESLSNFRALTTAKTVKESLELQSNIVRTSAVRAVTEASRFAHEGIGLAEKVSAPLTARAIAAVETLSSAKV